MNERKRGIFISYLQTIVAICVSLLYVPILLNLLGKDEYGLYQMVGSFFSFITIFKSSISNGVLKYYCKALQQTDKKTLENTLANARVIYRVISIIVLSLSVVIIIAFRIIYAASLQKSQIEEATWMLGLLFIDLLISTSNAIYVASVFAYEKFTLDRLITLAAQILQPIVCLSVVYFYPYAIYIVIIQVIMDAGIALMKYKYSIHILGVSIHMYSYDKQILKGILSLAGFILFSNIADQIFWKTDQLVLGKYLSTAVVAVYSIAMQINMCYMNIGIAISSVFFPKLSSLNEKEDGINQMSNLFAEIGKYAYMILLLILSGFIVFGREFIALWVGDEYLDAYIITLIVIIPYTIDIIQHMGLSILQIVGKYAFRAKMYFISAIINMAFTIILVRQLGMIGAAMSTGISLLIVNGIIMNIYYQKKVGMDLLVFWKNIIEIT
ncbi:MAG: oligosaccharide flippase family protein, partial [Eubacterium sp.]|nr:oligosaccharide flippase family protein [Eubacterium sp.]